MARVVRAFALCTLALALAYLPAQGRAISRMRANPPAKRALSWPSSHHSLLRHATRVYRGTPEDFNSVFGWLSDNEILLWRPANIPYQFDAYDTRTHARKLMRGLSRRTGNHFLHAAESDGIWNYGLSPDLKRLLWRPKYGNVFVTALNGKEKEWKRDNTNGTMCWLDNRHWVDFVWDKNEETKEYICSQVLVGNLDDPDRTKKIPFPAHSPFEYAVDLPIVGTRNRVLAAWLYGEREPSKGANRADILEWRVKKHSNPHVKYAFRFPMGVQVVDAVFSPDRSRIAWWVKEDRQRKTGRGRISLLRLWLSDIDGGHRSEVGVAPAPETYAPSRLEWLPSGRHIVFAYKKAMWRIQAH